MSDSMWPHGLWPTRLLCPWDSPGQNTGVGCHSLLQGIFPTQGSNPSLLYWLGDSLPSELQGKPASLLNALCISFLWSNDIINLEPPLSQQLWLNFHTTLLSALSFYFANCYQSPAHNFSVILHRFSNIYLACKELENMTSICLFKFPTLTLSPTHWHFNP